jgi:hypothetical protein
VELCAYDHLAAMERPAPALTVLLKLRWMQLRRSFPIYGIVLLAGAVVGGVVFLQHAVEHDASYASYMAVGTLFAVWGLHQRRLDHHFLLRHLQHPHASMAVEYGVLLLPVALGLAFAKAWLAVALVLPALFVPWVPVKQGTGVRARAFRNVIPPTLFEWKSLVQSTHPLGLLLWFAAIGSCWLPVLPLFLVGAIAMLVAGAQEQCEPRAMLLATANDAGALLRLKVFGSMRIMIMMVLPVIIGATIFRPEWWWIHALFGVGMLVLVAYAIVLKYANYRPNLRLEANGANVAVAAVFAILPGLSLVPLIMLLTEVPKARANLNAYFHDHHR